MSIFGSSSRDLDEKKKPSANKQAKNVMRTFNEYQRKTTKEKRLKFYPCRGRKVLLTFHLYALKLLRNKRLTERIS